MNFIINRSEEKSLTKTINFLNFNNYQVLNSGSVSIALVFIQSHNDLMDKEFKTVIYNYIKDKTPYVLISQTQPASNIQLNCLNTFINLKIECSPYFDNYEMVYDYVTKIDKMYKKMFNTKHVNNATRKVKLNIKQTQEKAQDEIEEKLKKLKILIND